MKSRKVLLAWGKKLLSNWWRRDSVLVRKPAHIFGEELESRCVPTKFLWNPGTENAANLRWNCPGSWMENVDGDWEPTNAVPGANDDVNFFASFRTLLGSEHTNWPCVVNQEVTVRSVTVSGGYSKNIRLEKNLTISGTDVNSRLLLESSAATIRGTPESSLVEKVILEKNAICRWQGGKLIEVAIDVNRGQNTFAQMIIRDDVAPPASPGSLSMQISTLPASSGGSRETSTRSSRRVACMGR